MVAKTVVQWGAQWVVLSVDLTAIPTAANLALQMAAMRVDQSAANLEKTTDATTVGCLAEVKAGLTELHLEKRLVATMAGRTETKWVVMLEVTSAVQKEEK